jgi:hypothetical protein
VCAPDRSRNHKRQRPAQDRRGVPHFGHSTKDCPRTSPSGRSSRAPRTGLPELISPLDRAEDRYLGAPTVI